MKSSFKITYYLRTKAKDKENRMPLYIRSQQNSKKLHVFNTGVKLLKSQWYGGKPKNEDAKLMELTRKIQDTYRYLLEKGYRPDLKMIIENLNVKKPSNSEKIVDKCQEYIDNEKQGSEGIKKAVKTLKTNLEDFDINITFDSIKRTKIEAFLGYLRDKGVANNSQYKRIRALINVARYANKDLPELYNFKMRDSGLKTKNANRPRLNWQEVRSIMKTDPMTKMEETAKDLFILSCFSGLRISDLLTLQDGKLTENYFEKEQIKTNESVFITVHKWNSDLFKKYIKIPVKCSEQRLRDSLKSIFKRAGIDELCTYTKFVGKKAMKVKAEKYKTISFHAGRRFYARILEDVGCGGEIKRDELGHDFKSLADRYSGSPDHIYRIKRVQKAMNDLEKTQEHIAVMQVA